jgi:hypothetical protein
LLRGSPEIPNSGFVYLFHLGFLIEARTQLPIDEDSHFGFLNLEILNRPLGCCYGFDHISVDNLPELIFGKGFVFKNYLVPFFPYIPHKETWENFPGSVKEVIVEGISFLEFYSSYNIVSLQVYSLEVGGSLVP